MLSQAERKAKEEKKNELITRAEETLKTAQTEQRELTDAEAQELAEIRDNVRKIVEMLSLDDDIAKLDMAKKEDDTPKEEVEVKTEETRALEVEKQERDALEN